jgi:general secretion pathway protein J
MSQIREGRRPAAGSRGFTLLELMVALLLTGFLALIVYTSMSLSLRGVRRSQAVAERMQELRVGQNLLQRSLSSAIPKTLDTMIYFMGEPREMRFFTLLPLEAYNLGGAYHWRLILGQDEGGDGVLAVEETRNLNWRRDPEGVEIRQIIIHHLAGLRFVYGVGREEFTSWDGRATMRLPEWVRVELTMKGLEPQVLVIPIHAVETKSQASRTGRQRGGFPGIPGLPGAFGR